LDQAEFSPRDVKLAVTGNGNASKEQVEYMVTTILSMERQQSLHDATDALAIALCHGSRLGRPASKRSGDWSDFISANPERVASR
jgi:crossover junction endodeoxyribonuclease RuvC